MSERGMQNIYRIENDSFTGWKVSIKRDGKHVQKYFGDPGGKAAEYTLRQAKKKRDEILDRWEQFVGDYDDSPINYKFDSDTGHPGINITRNKERDTYAKYFQVCYTDPESGECQQRKFYIGYPEDSDYKAKYEAKLQKARKFLDGKNYQRFGARWGAYKKRWYKRYNSNQKDHE